MPASFDVEAVAQRLGTVLRDVRVQQGLSLADVEERSAGSFRASVVGAYERGERAISMPRLAKLADFYRVPLGDMLTTTDPRHGDDHDLEAAQPVVIDLVVLGQYSDQEIAVARFVRYLQYRRHDYNGRVMTVRSDDLDLVAAIDGQDVITMRARLRELGILR